MVFPKSTPTIKDSKYYNKNIEHLSIEEDVLDNIVTDQNISISSKKNN